MKREAPEPSASIFVQPTPHGIWSDNNNFGFAIPFAPKRGNRERIINLPEWGEPAVWTVSLGIDFSEGAWAGGGRGFDVVAEVTYGVGGAAETILVDWVAGTTFSVPMNAISINASWAVPAAFEYDAARPEDVELRVLLARGNRGGGIPPTKFAPLLNGEPHVTIADNAIAAPLARIPKFGKKLLLAPLDSDDLSNLLGSNNFVRFFGGPEPATAFPTGAFPIDAGLLLTGAAVPAFSKYVGIENLGGGANDAKVQLNFQLEL